MHREMNFWGGFTLRECLTIGFTAALIVLAEMLLRIPMHLPGHRVFPLAFFLLLARDAVDRRWAATLVGVLAAAGCVVAGRDGLDHLFKYVAAGAVTDIAALLAPRVLRSPLVGAATGALIGASWLPAGLLIDRLAGMDAGAALQHTLLKLGSAMLFGTAGGVLASSVSGRLRRSGVLPTRGVAKISLSAGQANQRPFPPAVS